MLIHLEDRFGGEDGYTSNGDFHSFDAFADHVTRRQREESRLNNENQRRVFRFRVRDR